MSIKISSVISWKLNPSTECIELMVKLPDNTDAIVEVPETKFAEMIDSIPALEEEKKLMKLYNTLFEIRTKRLLGVSDLAVECEVMNKKHEDLQTRFHSCQDKTTLFALTAESKDISSQKVIIDTKRHLIGLLIREEGKIRADIAKLQASKEMR
jgi:hypothetical protein